MTLLANLITLSLIQGFVCCEFTGLLSSCHMTVGGIGLQASARINHCRTPIDVTFLLKSSSQENDSNSSAISWKYTYVTTNHPESLEIPGSDRRIMLHIVANAEANPTEQNRKRVKVEVKAQFMLDGQTTQGLTFLDQQVAISHFEDCAYKAEEDKVADIAIGCITSIIILCALGLVGLGFFHKSRRRPEDEVDLVSNMERHQATSQRNSNQVHYVVPSNNQQEEQGEELKVYVSTCQGLRQVERTTSSTSNSTNSSDHKIAVTTNSVASSSSQSSRPSSSNDSTQDGNNIDTFDNKSSPAQLGAIPKRKVVAKDSESMESSSSSFVSR